MHILAFNYARYINKKYLRTGRVWECRYYSSIVDEERIYGQLFDTLNKIHEEQKWF